MRAHTEAVESFGMHGYEVEIEALVEEYTQRQHFGAMMACQIKPALYILQVIEIAVEDNIRRLIAVDIVINE